MFARKYTHMQICINMYKCIYKIRVQLNVYLMALYIQQYRVLKQRRLLDRQRTHSQSTVTNRTSSSSMGGHER